MHIKNQPMDDLSHAAWHQCVCRAPLLPLVQHCLGAAGNLDARQLELLLPGSELTKLLGSL